MTVMFMIINSNSCFQFMSIVYLDCLFVKYDYQPCLFHYLPVPSVFK